MPWLVGTALVHSLIVTEKRGAFRNWTVLLSIFAFSLSLLGTFIVRSGVLTSVHSFAADPSRGLFILLLLGIAIGGSLTLFAFRASEMSSPARFELKSKETMLLICNVLLTVAAGTVLLGTLYPLLIDALGMGKISVGPPYFNAVFVPIVLVLFGFMGIGPIIRWKKSKPGEIKKQLLVPAIIALVVGVSAPFVADGQFNAWVMCGVAATTWIMLSTLRAAYNIVSNKEGGISLNKMGRSQLGMIVAHFGIAVSVMGATIVSNYSIEKSVRMGPGISQELAGYTFKYLETKNVVGPNYTAQQGQIEIYKDDEFITLLKPDRRQYNVRTMDMTEAGIDWGLFRDLYVTMGSIFMMIGGFLAASDKRYRVKQVATEDAAKAKLATA